MQSFAAAAFAFILGLTLESITSWIAIRGARKNHPELWAHSGCPTLLGNGDLLSAWPLVKYYKDRDFLKSVQYGDVSLPPINDHVALDFAERLRKPLVHGYFAGWAGVGLAVAILIVTDL